MIDLEVESRLRDLLDLLPGNVRHQVSCWVIKPCCHWLLSMH